MNSDPIFNDKILLVVDDDAQGRRLIIDTLLDILPDMEVWAAKDGVQALEILEHQLPHLILLDWEMPEMNGIETLTHLKGHSQWKNIPVVMYTGAMTKARNLELAFEKGAIDFLRKPADPIELLARIRSIFREKKLEEDRLQIETELLELKNHTLEQENAQLKQNLNNRLLQLAQKNKFLMELKEKYEKHASKLDKPTAYALLKEIDRYLSEDQYWDNFLLEFKKMDPVFLQVLAEKHDNLSPTELKTCALIRLGLDNKTIAHLFNISDAGIKKSRYRIRKKLALQTHESLENYLFCIK